MVKCISDGGDDEKCDMGVVIQKKKKVDQFWVSNFFSREES